MLTRIEIQNYRRFSRFSMPFTPGLNILVGDNDSGKSTILEATRLALTGRLGERWLAHVLSPYHFNQEAVAEYVEKIRSGEQIAPPEIIIDLFLEANDDTAPLRGTNNLAMDDEPGLRIKASLDRGFRDEYLAFIANPGSTTLVPVEYYKVEWSSFAGNGVTLRSIPASVSRIDASAIRLQSGADYYMQQIIGDHLGTNERVELSRSYRTLREAFTEDPSIVGINQSLAASAGDLTDRQLSLSIDISHRTAWERSLVPHLDDLPFQFVGAGAQSTLKILLALERSADDSHVVLVEEPENHLSPASLNALVRRIADRCEGKQVLVSTHSSFVLNKLGLDSLVLLHGNENTRLADLPKDTLDYFKKLSGYDTLRIVLANRIVLVEGPSDELIVQRAYLDKHGCLPIEAGVDVINVRGLSFKRFLDIAVRLSKRVSVLTDNDGGSVEDTIARYAEYVGNEEVTVHTGASDGGDTLEPQIVAAAGREAINGILETDFATDEELARFMGRDKTAWALRVFESETSITFPPYILDALE